MPGIGFIPLSISLRLPLRSRRSDPSDLLSRRIKIKPHAACVKAPLWQRVDRESPRVLGSGADRARTSCVRSKKAVMLELKRRETCGAFNCLLLRRRRLCVSCYFTEQRGRCRGSLAG